MERKIVLKQDIKDALGAVGLREGMNIMVHTSLKSLGFVCGGAQVVIEALMECIGQEGSIMMPTQSWKNLDPTAGVHWEEPEEWWQLIRDNWPAYQKEITPTNTMGAVAEMFRKWPGVLRSNHPARSVAAWGKYADYLTKDHDLSDIFGESSPIGKLYQLDGYVLLLGVGYDKNTSLHLADVRAEYPGKHLTQESSAVMEHGQRIWKTYDTLYVDGEDFCRIGLAFEKSYTVNQSVLGNGTIKLMKQRELVDYAVRWIENNRRELMIDNGFQKETFRDTYLLKEELVQYCREHGLSTGGSKIELTDRIALYLEQDGQIDATNKDKKCIKCENTCENYQNKNGNRSTSRRTVIVSELHEDSLIEPNFVCSEIHRAFFKEKIGNSFSFNVAFQKWLKGNTGKTYGDAITAYHAIMKEKKNSKTTIDRQFEYNTYIRDFFEDNPGKTLKEAINCWNYRKKQLGEHKYQRIDLEYQDVTR